MERSIMDNQGLWFLRSLWRTTLFISNMSTLVVHETGELNSNMNRIGLSVSFPTFGDFLCSFTNGNCHIRANCAKIGGLFKSNNLSIMDNHDTYSYLYIYLPLHYTSLIFWNWERSMNCYTAAILMDTPSIHILH